jgi:nicotinate-nucleotide adenylyltransferase
MRVGMMGGTFDPIHYGHLFLAEAARVEFNLERVLFIPNGTPPHKKTYNLTPAEHRFEMTRIATATNPYFECNDTEMHRTGPSYAVDTLTSLKALLPEAELYYITGVDAVAEVLTWRNHEKVFELAQFIAASRPGYDSDSLTSRLPATYLERIQHISSLSVDTSSTEIRSRLSKALPIRYLIPDEVLEYICKHNLYCGYSKDE